MANTTQLQTSSLFPSIQHNESKSKSFFPSLSIISFSSHHLKPISSLCLPSISSKFHPIYCSLPSSSLTSTFSSNSQEEEEEEKDNDEISTTRLVAQNLPWSSTIDDIRSLFQQHGTVLHVELSMHNKTRNRGLAFVEMSSPEEAAQALSKLESYEFEGRSLKLNYAKPKKKKTSPPVQPKPPVLYNLFVANLSFEVRSKDLKEFFQTNGADVISADVIFLDNPRRPSGYGFVSFKTKKEADEVLSSFQGKEMMGRPVRVARSKRFVKLESEVKVEFEDSEDMLDVSKHESEQPEAVVSL